MRTTIVMLLLASASCFAMGNRPPTDLATYQDILDTTGLVSATSNREAADNAAARSAIAANAAQEQSDNQMTNARIDKMNQTKVLVEGVVRLYDGKRIALEAFNAYDARQGHNFALGTRITLKLGPSYEERLLAAQAKQIAALEAMLKGGK